MPEKKKTSKRQEALIEQAYREAAAINDLPLAEVKKRVPRSSLSLEQADPTDRDTAGIYNTKTKKIKVTPRAEPKMQKTLVHEISHALGRKHPNSWMTGKNLRPMSVMSEYEKPAVGDKDYWSTVKAFFVEQVGDIKDWEKFKSDTQLRNAFASEAGHWNTRNFSDMFKTEPEKAAAAWERAKKKAQLVPQPKNWWDKDEEE